MLEFGYWNIKGQAEPSRILMNYLGLKYTEISPKNFQEWLAHDKPQLGAPFPNLPYLKDGDFIVTESSAIPFYLVHKANRPDLLGNGLIEQTNVRAAIEITIELVQIIFKNSNNPNPVPQFTRAFKLGGSTYSKISEISKLLGDKEWLFGHLTLADFEICNALDWLRVVAISTGTPCPVCPFDNVYALMNRFSELSGVKEYLATRAQTKYMPDDFMLLRILTKAEISDCVQQHNPTEENQHLGD